MTIDPNYTAKNRAATERMKALAARLTVEELGTNVGEHWTVAITFAHLAFWDRRVMHVLDKTEQQGKLFNTEVEIFVNDLSLPLWAAIPPREALRIAIESAEELDQRLDDFNPRYLEEIYNYNQRWVLRALHRNDHLDEAEEALRD